MIHSALSTALIISAMADLIFAVKSYIQIPALQKIIAAAYAEFMVLHFKAFCKVLGRVTGKLSQKQSQIYIYTELNESVMRNSWKISEVVKIEVLVGESSISGQCSIATFDCWKVRKVAGPFPKRLSPGVSCRHP